MISEDAHEDHEGSHQKQRKCCQTEHDSGDNDANGSVHDGASVLARAAEG